MSHCLLTQRLQRSLFCFNLGLFIGMSGCAKDPILQAAESMETDAQENGAPVQSEEGVVPGTPEEPLPGVPGDAMTEGLAEEPTPGNPEDPEPGIPEDPEPAAPGAENMPEPPPSGDGVPAQPEVGVPDEPKPAPPGTPGGAEHSGKGGGIVDEGPHVIIRGSISSGSLNGKIRIDLFDGDQRNVSGPRPKVVGVHEINESGPFEVSIPASVGKVWLGAYLDANKNNRPDKGEAVGWYSRNPVHLDDVPKAVNITLKEEGKASGLGLDFGE